MSAYDTPSPFLRAVSAAVQGAMNRFPQRDVRGLLGLKETSGHVTSDVIIAIKQRGKGPSPENNIWNLYVEMLSRDYSIAFFEQQKVWYVEGFFGKRAGQRPDTQAEVEKTMGIFFNHIYPVQHVTDKAISIARELIERRMRL